MTYRDDFSAELDVLSKGSYPTPTSVSPLNQGLLGACRELLTIRDAGGVLRELPRLARAVCPAPAAHIIETRGKGPEQPGVIDPQLAVVTLQGLDGPPLAVELERPQGCPFTNRELHDLELFGFVASLALSQARSQAAMQSLIALESTLMSAVREAIIALDTDGMILAVSATAATILGRRSKDAVGQRLRDLPGVAPLVAALAGDDPSAGTRKVGLPTGEFSLQVRKYRGGVAVTLSALRTPLPGFTQKSQTLFGLEDLVGSAPEMVRVRELARNVADSALPVLITGETGTGKEILAQSLHTASARAESPFIGINVSALPRELLESELFGYEAGAFTGANVRGSPGKFELAENGTLLLDEIGDMPIDMQAKLLRVLQERAVQRLGGGRPRPYSCQLIASTNRELEDDVAGGRFRLDLLHRLRVVQIRLPPLRERPGDVRLLVEHRLQSFAEATHRPRVRVSPHVMNALEAYHWPGNVRELMNAVDSEVSQRPKGKDVIDVVPEAVVRGSKRAAAQPNLREVLTLEEAERVACVKALDKAQGNVPSAARILGVAKTTLYSKMRRYGLGFAEPGGQRASIDSEAGKIQDNGLDNPANPRSLRSSGTKPSV